MKTKKHLIALAIFGGMLFPAQATSLISLNEQEAPQIERWRIKIPTHGLNLNEQEAPQIERWRIKIPTHGLSINEQEAPQIERWRIKIPTHG
ncbi:hypothetical protein BN863_14630 [Formosa agariphila KMM 3901]|uniref:Uncharacterized protein n=1 Tax=Formosa agariphila (strain DSM 15362 / KCTC 12365 / LMG 23005 / KMM 3901 / M-2Alg 35-1) TaxID=1347342 RepID=T2KK76_FORAG|nr:hypothetical protein [Formosa agariphila]CDF79175.1 hypothetical protein BN863_14630 [Formosa agariphila KMM 3901]